MGVNGWLNGLHLFQLRNHPQLHHPRLDTTWPAVRTVLGVCMFACGMAINRHSDTILTSLRKPGETGYKIPRGGMFKYVTKANYYGEIMQWGGFGVATWNIAGLLFFLNTMA